MLNHVIRTMICLTLFAVATLPAMAESPKYDRTFWNHWGDGQAEVASYQLSYPRYGEVRTGTAVAIFVTETFSNDLRVKADPGNHPKSDEFPVLKLNLVQDFPTGLYDYNMMTSTFIALKNINSRPAGHATKVSFSAQEWCGHAYQQVLFDRNEIRHELHSYFDGEADQKAKLDHPKNAISEDALLLWARGLAWPKVEAGETTTVNMLRSLEYVRLGHKNLNWAQARLTHESETAKITVPAGTFDVSVMKAAIAAGPTWTFHVEKASPHRIIKWESDQGHKGELIKSERFKYWQMNGEGAEKNLQRIGLSPRPPATP